MSMDGIFRPRARQQPPAPAPVEGDGYPHAEMLQAARDRLTIYEAHVAELEAFDALAGIPRKWSDTDETLLELKRRVRACELACRLADVPVPEVATGASSRDLWAEFGRALFMVIVLIVIGAHLLSLVIGP